MRACLLLWSCACVVALGLGAPAWAEDEVQIDPDSPAGREYELPVDRARQDASPHKTNDSSGVPLFGAGVGDTKNGAAAGSSASSARGSQSKRRSSAGGELNPADPKSVERADAAAPSSGTGEVLAIGAGAAGVLLLGGIGGLALRRRSGER